MISGKSRVGAFLLLAASGHTVAQSGDINTEIELGAVFTSGNTEERNVTYGVTVDWTRNLWDYQFTSDGLRNRRAGVTTAQRFYHVGRGRRDLTEDHFFQVRGAFEADRFNGYDFQTDLSATYGTNWLGNVDNMTLSTEVGPGYRLSEGEKENLSEFILRAAAEYEWAISETANFYQDLALEFGQDTSIYRSESGVESEVLEDISLRFSINIRHQTEVPVSREKTDTQTAVTLVWNF
jgi:putative salt-induced outer membrane protein